GEPAVPSWTNDIVPIFYASCGAETAGCHSREAYNTILDRGCLSWVSFEDVPLGAEIYAGGNPGMPTGCPDLPLYERIIDRSSWQCGAWNGAPTKVIVKPGSPDESYLMQKIMGVTCEG